MKRIIYSAANVPSLLTSFENQGSSFSENSTVITANPGILSPLPRERSMSPTRKLRNDSSDDDHQEAIPYSPSRDRRPHERAHQAAAARGSKIEHDTLVLERRKNVIRTSWRAVQFGLDIKACEIFYDRLFEQRPHVRGMFPSNMQAQYHKLYAAVSLAVQVLDQPDALLPVLRDLGRQHARYGVKRQYYEDVIECFLWTLNSYIATKMPTRNALLWMNDVTDAWDWVLTLIGKTMADAADEDAARMKDEEEARLAVEEILRLSKSTDC